ncbi:MAG: glutamyl-Q tRNA(Asp) synthetase [Pseudomonadota bacterium]|jgi:glutamyl-Q tRNA(Asp) synthetase
MNFSEGATPSGAIGRFAPSPTGPLHFGSLVAAVGSYLDAIVVKGQWLFRIEDVDTPRTVPGMAELQVNALAAYGFVWDGEVIHQSSRSACYQAALESLISAGSAYPCTCTRSQIASAPGVRTGVDGTVYPGTCAHWAPGDPVPEGAAWRFRVPQGITGFEDRICGAQQQDLQRDVGDFPLRRADGCFTYQLAVVVDDMAQGVTDVVRGADLLDSTPRQIALIHALGGVVPTYAHLPVVKNGEGEKLSKQTRAEAIPLAHEADRVAQIWQALAFLGQSPPLPLKTTDQRILWAWAEANWNISLLRATNS